MNTEINPQVRVILRQELTDFFVTLTTADDTGWPNIGEQELADAIADSLLLMGKQRGMGTAMLQTLVHELQDRINLSLK